MGAYDDILGGGGAYDDILSGGSTVKEAQAQGRKLPGTWAPDIPGIGKVNAVYDPDANAYLLPLDKGRKVGMIAKGDNGLQIVEYKPKAPSSLGTNTENFRAGMGKAFVDTGRGIGQLLGMDNQAAIDDARSRDAELMGSKAGIAGNIAGHAALYAAPASLLAKTALGAKAIQAASAIPKTAALVPAALGGALYAGAQPVATGEDRGQNMLVGGLAGAGGQALGRAIGAGVQKLSKGASDTIRPEVIALAERAKQLGIPLRTEQIINSKPLSGVVAATDMLPLTGYGKSMANQQKSFNEAIAKTVGEATDNPIQALSNAEARLGGEFDRVLKSSKIIPDNQLGTELADISSAANRELTPDLAKIVNNLIDDLLGKVDQNGMIDGQAAYNIKRTLDRIGKQNTPQAFHAREIKDALMSALNRSLGPEEAAAFAKTRQQWANMRELQKLVPSGAEGDISAARLSNARNIKSKDLKELADISGQFLKKGKTPDSGTTQRAINLGALMGGGNVLGVSPATVAAGIPVGRGINALMDSSLLQAYLMKGAPALQPAANIANKEGLRNALQALSVGYAAQ